MHVNVLKNDLTGNSIKSFLFYACRYPFFLCPNLASYTSPAPLSRNIEKEPQFVYGRTIFLHLSIFPN